jgi:hypothetical protein
MLSVKTANHRFLFKAAPTDLYGGEAERGINLRTLNSAESDRDCNNQVVKTKTRWH